MVFISDEQQSSKLSLGEYVDFVTSHVDVTDYDCLVETSWALRALANDRDFILDYYHTELKNLYDKRSSKILTPQSVPLAKMDNSFIRANIWLPAARDEAHRAGEKKLYAYDLPHDHNFDFVSVGYFGVGYETDLFTYEFDSVTGHIDEPVNLIDCGRQRMSPGRVMVYKANSDVHVQYEPPKVSLSINLIPLTSRAFKRPQFVFDLKRKTISAGVSDQVSSRLFLMNFFKYMSNEKSIDILTTIMKTHECPRTRGRALNVLMTIKRDESSYFLSIADKDTTRFVGDNIVHAGLSRQREID